MAIRKTFGAVRVNYVDANSTPDRATDSELCAFAFAGSMPVAITHIVAGFSTLDGGVNSHARLFVLSVDSGVDLNKLAKDADNELVELTYGARVLLDVTCTGFLDLDFSGTPIANKDGRNTVVLLQVPRDYMGALVDCSQFLNVQGFSVTDGSSDIIYPPSWRGR